MPTLGAGPEEIAIDINELDNRTLWKLHNFVQTCKSERHPPDKLLLAAVACAAPGTVCGVPVQQLRDDEAIGSLNLYSWNLGAIGVELLSLMLPVATSLRELRWAARTTPLAHPLQHHRALCWQPHQAIAFASQRPLTLLTASSTPLLAVCKESASVPREQPLSPRASRATRRCKSWSRPLGAEPEPPRVCLSVSAH